MGSLLLNVPQKVKNHFLALVLCKRSHEHTHNQHTHKHTHFYWSKFLTLPPRLITEQQDNLKKHKFTASRNHNLYIMVHKHRYCSLNRLDNHLYTHWQHDTTNDLISLRAKSLISFDIRAEKLTRRFSPFTRPACGWGA